MVWPTGTAAASRTFSFRSRGLLQSVYLMMVVFVASWLKSSSNCLDRALTSPSVGVVLAHPANATTNLCHHQRLQPSCPMDDGRNNIVWYNYGDRAGLDDRRQILWTLSNLAVSLCARVVVPPPWQLLDPDRHFTDVDPALTWEDLIRVTTATTSIAGGGGGGGGGVGNASVLHEMRTPEREFLSNKYNAYRRLTTRQPTNFFRDYQDLRKHILEEKNNNLPFLWEVKVSWHQVKQGHWWPGVVEPKSVGETTLGELSIETRGESTLVPAVFLDSQLSPSPVDGCLWIQPFDIPDEMKIMVDTIWNEIQRSSPVANTTTRTVGFLHIRRGDSIHRCDTSLPKLETYLSCSLSTLPGNHPVILLLASDELDPEYRQGIFTIVNRLGEVARRDIRLIDLDGLVWRHVQYLRRELQTNYYVYAVEWYLKRNRVDFSMERRHSQLCHDCETLG